MAFNKCSRLIIYMIGQFIIGVHAQHITARQPKAIVEEGRNFTFEWDFRLDSGDRLDQIVFGLWDNEFTSVYLMTVNRKEEPVENPDLRHNYPSFVNRVHWTGDFKSYAAFTLTKVRRSDSKSYGCELGVGGFGKTIASKITLTVKKRPVKLHFPELFRVPHDRIVLPGQETEFHWEYRVSDKKDTRIVEFSRETSSHSLATIIWKIQSNETTINSEYSKRLDVSFTNTRHGKGRQFTFKLRKVTIEDAGKYIFKVYFVADSRMSDVYLYVKDRPKIVGSREAIEEGRELLLYCEVQGNSTPQTGWLINERLIPQQRERYLHIQNVTLTDAGSYKCCAFYQLRFSLTRFCSVKMPLQVKYAPKIFYPSGTKTVLWWEGHQTKLNCSAVGNPPAQFSWTSGNRGSKRSLDVRRGGNTSVLTITSSLDLTNHTCTAHNDIGDESRIFIVKPIHPPKPPVIKSVKLCYKTLKITWEVASVYQVTPITGYVLRMSQESTESTEIRVIPFKEKSNYVIVKNLTEETRYRLWLHAMNVAGRSNASEEKQVHMLKEGCPGVPRVNFMITYINVTSFDVSWDVPHAHGGAIITAYTLWLRELATNRSTHGLWFLINTTEPKFRLKLNCCRTYEIMVTAWNKYGQSFTDPDNAAKITVLRDIDSGTMLTKTSKPKCASCIPELGTSKERNTNRTFVKYLPYLGFLLIPILLCSLMALRLSTRKHAKYFMDIKVDDVRETEVLENDPLIRTSQWEIPRGNLAMERIIGSGAFGVVSKAYVRYLPDKEEWTTVAVKSLPDGAAEGERRDLLSELNLLKKLKPHPHIIRLLACVTIGQEGPLVIIEYVPYGDLLGYLRRSRGVTDRYYDEPDIKPKTSLTSEQMLKFAWQISDGMRYIASKKIIHRDLAARNVLVGENHTCKITDFGMARDVNLEEIYVPRNEGRIPVKWTALEAMTGSMKYSTQSDVWSFGVVLFEICTIGAEPYPGISPYKIPSVLLKGYRIPKPDYVKEDLYAIMMECWKTEPDDRPSFEALCMQISELKARANQNYVNIGECLQARENEQLEITS